MATPVVTSIEQEGGQQSGQTAYQASSQSTTKMLNNALYRHPSEKLVGGVCGGIADYFGWDAALIRILWLVATIATGGGGLLAYIVLWGLLPVGTRQSGVQEPAAFELNERNIGRIATILIALGVLWLLSNIGILPWLWNFFWFTFGILFWPALLIGVGYLLLRGSGNAEMKIDFGDLRNRFQDRVRNVKVPGSSDLKSNLSSGRQRFPLRRSTTDRLFMGVCGGIGQRTGIDANLVRLLWAAFSIGSIGMGVLVYVAFGLFLPEESPSNGSQDAYDIPVERAQDVEIVEGTKPQAV